VRAQQNKFAANKTDASAKALNAGMDLYGGWGDDFWGEGDLSSAIDAGLTSAAKVDDAVRRTTMHKMKVGLFDPPANATDGGGAASAASGAASGTPADWRTLGLEAVDSPKTQQVAYEMGLQGMVLLKNGASSAPTATSAAPVLPLAPGSKVAVVGPFATDPSLYHSDYAGDTVSAKYSVSIGDAIARVNNASAGAATAIEAGVPVAGSANKGDVAKAVAAVEGADVTVLVLGISRAQEHEGMDRHDTVLPAVQAAFAATVLAAAAGKPVVLVTVSGGILSIDALVDPCAAIVDSFNPTALGATALADLVFGKENRWGKLPVTIYPANYSSTQVMQDMSYHTNQGRSYRYYQGTPLFAFGSGLSYTTFAHACAASGASNATEHVFTCTVTNTGAREGDEVVLAYHKAGDAIRAKATHPVPLKQLVDFERVRLAAGAEATVSFSVPARRLALTNNDGDYALYAGEHSIIFSRGNGEDVEIKVNVAKDDVHKNLHPE
jgi:hypothetical protein